MLVVVTGGSASGKSSFAEALCMALSQPRYYVATMRPFGAYEQERISRHLALRDGKGFHTLEWYGSFRDEDLPARGGTALLECLGNLVANEMFGPQGELLDPISAVMEDVATLRACVEHVIVVTNEVGSDGTAGYSDETLAYIRALGSLNCMLAAQADAVVEVTCGTPRVLKGSLPCVGDYPGAVRWDEEQPASASAAPHSAHTSATSQSASAPAGMTPAPASAAPHSASVPASATFAAPSLAAIKELVAAGDFAAINAAIPPISADARRAAQNHWNQVGKPIGSLGAFEDIIVQIAGITGSSRVSLEKRAAIPFCADNGVVEEGVTQTGQDVTAIVAQNMALGVSSVCRMGATAHVEVFPVDVGMVHDAADVPNRKVARGTANFTKGPAMTRAQALQAIFAGIEHVGTLAGDGYQIFVSGEMGIGNTTTSSAMATVLLGCEVEEVTGRGAGLSNAGLVRKIDAIKRGIARNAPDPADPLDILAKVGGFDIAAMVGSFIGAALFQVPIVMDGLISSVAALAAVRLVPACAGALIASHSSREPAAQAILTELGVQPLLYAGLCLGEGTGAVCMLPLLDMALAVYDGLSFDEIGVETYEVMAK